MTQAARYGGVLAWLAALLWSSGCSKAPAGVATGTNAGPAWSWAAFPLTTNMRLGLVSGRVMPRNNYSIVSPLSGPLHFNVDQAQTNLPEGFVWAEFEPKLLAAEGAALEQAKARAVEKERLLFEIELPRQKLRMRKEIEDAQRQIALLELFSQHPEVAPTAARLAGIKEPLLSPATVKQAKQELSLLQTNFQYLCETNPTVFGADLQVQRADLQRQELDLERRQHQMRFAMPFAGQLSLSLPLMAGVSEYPVSMGQELAVVRDTGSILLRAVLNDPAWTSLPAEQMRAVIALPTGTRLEARFAHKRLEKSQLREEIIYYFEFPVAVADSTTRLLGAELTCELWITLPEPAHIVPKLALVLQSPAAFGTRRWNEGLERLFPGARLLLEGQTDLAICTP